MAVLRTGYSSDRNKSGELQTKGNEGNEGEKRLNGLRAQLLLRSLRFLLFNSVVCYDWAAIFKRS